MGSTRRASRPAPARSETQLPVTVDDPASLGFFQAAFDRNAVSYFASNIWSVLIFRGPSTLSRQHRPPRAIYLQQPHELDPLPDPDHAGWVRAVSEPGGRHRNDESVFHPRSGSWLPCADESPRWRHAQHAIHGPLALAIPLDGLVRPLLAGYYAIRVPGLLAMVVIVLAYTFTQSTSPSLFMEEWDSATFYILSAGMTVVVLLLHVLIVLAGAAPAEVRWRARP